MDRKIISFQNPLVKKIVKLRQKREREKSKLYLIEGYRELLRAIEGKAKLKMLFYSPNHFLKSNEWALIRKAKSVHFIETVEVSPAIFEKLSYRDRPDGLLAIAEIEFSPFSELKLSEVPFFLIAEAIEKPGNLGSMLRSCDGAGVDAFILCDPKADIYNPNVVRASVGTLFSVPFFVQEKEALLKFLKKKKIQIIAAMPCTDQIYTNAFLSGPLALILGTEQLGLSTFWLENADLKVKIPMKGSADSLNVAAATTLLLYEVVRQRTLSL